MTESGTTIHETEYMTVRAHTNGRVSVSVGRTKKERTPTVVDAMDLRDALTEFINGLDTTDLPLARVECKTCGESFVTRPKESYTTVNMDEETVVAAAHCGECEWENPLRGLEVTNDFSLGD